MIYMNIEIKNCVYKVHPFYNLYASDEKGNIIHLVRQVRHQDRNIKVVIWYVG